MLTPALSLILFSSLFAQAADTPPKVGDKIPAATVTTAKGKALELRKAVADKPAVLIFYRGGWCPYCVTHLQSLMDIEKDLTQAGYQLLAISPDSPESIAKTPEGEKLTYQLLSDSKVEAAKAFGLSFKVADELVEKYVNEYQIDIEAASGQKHHLLPHPAVFVVNTKGVVKFAHINPNYKERLDAKKVLKAAQEASQ